MKKSTIYTAAILSVITLFSCSKDDDTPEIINEEEVISKVVLTLTNNADLEDIVTYTYEDHDGVGGEAPETTVSGPLSLNSTYKGSIEFHGAHEHEGEEHEGEEEEEAEDITSDIKDEGKEHEVFYTFSDDNSGITVTKKSEDDKDINDNPIGLKPEFKTTNAINTTLTVTLIHLPIKPNTGLESAGGSTDVKTDFNITVQ
ncbi:type 1 periplasmic binding fold superfamily protein [Flavobacteriaceae bacterium]|nr:type 1 periplasmic binding fold superfamily protein [Flavobacteriaceae bacterium]